MPTSPVLSINVGSSYVSFLLFEEGREFATFTYPYVYSKNLFGHFISESSFYLDVLKIAAKALKVTAKDCTLLISGFPEPPHVEADVKLSASIDKILATFSQYSCLYVGNFKFLEAHSFMYACPITTQELDKMNSDANLSLYPQITQLDELKRFDIDSVARVHRSQLPDILDTHKPVVFTGCSFCNFSEQLSPLSYILALDLIREHGTFELKLDEHNVLPNLGLINMYDGNLLANVSDYKLTSLGTILNLPGTVECLFESDYGTSQLIDVAKDKLFFVPLEEGSTARIVAKNSLTGTIEKTVTGGKLGFIIDTRDKSGVQDYSSKKYAPWLKSLKEVLEGLYVYSNA